MFETTIVMVTHEAAAALHADRVVVLRDGLISGEFPVESSDDAGQLAARYQAMAAPRPLRVLCSFAIAAAVALVVCVGAGFDSLHAALDQGISKLLGVAEIQIPCGSGRPQRPPPCRHLEQLRSNPQIAGLSGRFQNPISLTNPADHRWFDSVAIDPVADEAAPPQGFSHRRSPHAGRPNRSRRKRRRCHEGEARRRGHSLG